VCFFTLCSLLTGESLSNPWLTPAGSSDPSTHTPFGESPCLRVTAIVEAILFHSGGRVTWQCMTLVSTVTCGDRLFQNTYLSQKGLEEEGKEDGRYPFSLEGGQMTHF
jgi:hypothetical protein